MRRRTLEAVFVCRALFLNMAPKAGFSVSSSVKVLLKEYAQAGLLLLLCFHKLTYLFFIAFGGCFNSDRFLFEFTLSKRLLDLLSSMAASFFSLRDSSCCFFLGPPPNTRSTCKVYELPLWCRRVPSDSSHYHGLCQEVAGRLCWAGHQRVTVRDRSSGIVIHGDETSCLSICTLCLPSWWTPTN